MKGLIVYAPGNGMSETAFAKEIAAYKMLSHIIIDVDGSQWKPGDPAPNDTLIITNCANVKGALDFSEVIHRMHCHSLEKQKRTAYEIRNALLFSHTRYSSKEIARYMRLPVWLLCIRKVFVLSLNWLPLLIRDRLGIR
jgi:hypothetical protein